MESQRAGNGHALLLAAGELVRVVVCPLREAHLGQQLSGLCFQLGVDGLFVGLIIRPLLCQQLSGQHHILQGRVLREEVKVLEHEAEVEPLFADLALPLGGGVGGIPHGLTVDLDDAGIRPLQKVEAAQQCGFARTGGTNDRQRLAFFQSQ